MVRARMAVWLLLEPWRVMMPSSFDLSSRTISLGVRSSVARMAGRLSCMEASERLVRMFTIRRETSRTSADRARMYSSSTAAKAAANSLPAAETAYSAVPPCSSIMRLTASR